MTDSWTSGTFECETQRKDGKRVCVGPKGGKAWVSHMHAHTHAHSHTHTGTHCDLALLWAALDMKALMLPAVWDELCVALQQNMQVCRWTVPCGDQSRGDCIHLQYLGLCGISLFLPIYLILSFLSSCLSDFFCIFIFCFIFSFSSHFISFLSLEEKTEWVSFTFSRYAQVTHNSKITVSPFSF